MKMLTGLLLAVALTVPALPAAAEDGTVDPARVMVVGDSVTHGLSGQYTWRYFSWKGLQQTGGSVDFVGPHRGTYSDAGWFAGSYADPGFDQDHASRYGLSMWETLFYPNAETAPSVEALMTSDPDVIVNALGVNDLTIMNQTPEELARYVGDFVRKARTVNPGVDVVVLSLPQVWFERVPVYNALLPGVAAELSTPESRVVVTPVADFVNGVDTTDDAHPTTVGMRKIAEVVSVGLEQLGIGRRVLMPDPGATSAPVPPVVTEQPSPEPVAPPVADAPAAPAASPGPPSLARPDAPGRVRAVRVGGGTTVSWRAREGAASYAVRCGRAARSVEVRRVVVRTQASSCKVRSVNGAGVSDWARVRVRVR